LYTSNDCVINRSGKSFYFSRLLYTWNHPTPTCASRIKLLFEEELLRKWLRLLSWRVIICQRISFLRSCIPAWYTVTDVTRHLWQNWVKSFFWINGRKKRGRETGKKRGQPVDIVVDINNRNKNSTKVLAVFQHLTINCNIFNLASILGLRLKPDSICRAVRTKKFKFKYVEIYVKYYQPWPFFT